VIFSLLALSRLLQQFSLGGCVLATLPALLVFSVCLLLIKGWIHVYYQANDKREKSYQFLEDFDALERSANLCVYGLVLCALFVAVWVVDVSIEHVVGAIYGLTSVLELLCIGYFARLACAKYAKALNFKHLDVQHFSRISTAIGMCITCIALLCVVYTIVTIGLLFSSTLVFFLYLLYTTEIMLLLTCIYLLTWYAEVSLPSGHVRRNLPDDPASISLEWMSDVLREKGSLTKERVLTTLNRQPLVEGCHFKVSRFDIAYSQPQVDGRTVLPMHSEQPSVVPAVPLPTSVVVKILSWDKQFSDRMLLNLKNLLYQVPPDRQTMYLKSYQVEAHFYRNFAHSAKGFRIPRVYYNLEDSFHGKFGMVMQEVQISSDGVANGFTFDECKFILKRLAKYHAVHWACTDKQRRLLAQYNVWSQGGYWVGDKRRDAKSCIAQDWATFYRRFATSSSLRERHLIEFPSNADETKFGRRLQRALPHILENLRNATSPLTLVHGDFKVSNIFISEKNAHKKGTSSSSPSLATDAHHHETESSEPVVRSNSNSSFVGGTSSASDDDMCDAATMSFLSLEDSKNLYVIDWQWFGVGLSVTDLAHFIFTSVDVSVLQDKQKMKSLLRYYHTRLQHSISAHKRKQQAAENQKELGESSKEKPDKQENQIKIESEGDYPFKQFYNDFQLATLDFFCYMVTGKWVNMKEADFLTLAKEGRNGLNYRSFQHVQMMIHYVLKYLTEFERQTNDFSVEIK